MSQPNHIPLQKPEIVKAPPASTAIAVQEDSDQVGFSTKSGFELMQRAATLLSSSSLVPKEFQKNLPNCVIALNMANRIGADPLMVMQNLYVVHGRPSWSAQFLIATFNQSGRFTSLRFEFFGEKGKDTWGCRAWAVEKSTGEKLFGSDITIALSKSEGWYGKSGSKWQSMAQQMLMYRAASWFVRAYAPELAMGLHTQDEMEDIGPGVYDAPNNSYKVLDIPADADAVIVTEKKAENLEEFKEKNAPKVSKQKPADKPAAPASCKTCVGQGFVHTDEGKEPCGDCGGTGKVE